MGYDDLTDWDPADDDPDPWDFLTPDAPNPEAVAYHEAGHAIAAVLCGVAWTDVQVNQISGTEFYSGAAASGRATYVEEHIEDTTPANVAFIAWAGCWAEARHRSPDNPWRVLPGVQHEGGGGDMGTVHAYWSDPAHAPHETDEQWARNLDSAWKHVETLAERLARERVVRTPLHPEWHDPDDE